MPNREPPPRRHHSTNQRPQGSTSGYAVAEPQGPSTYEFANMDPRVLDAESPPPNQAGAIWDITLVDPHDLESESVVDSEGLDEILPTNKSDLCQLAATQTAGLVVGNLRSSACAALRAARVAMMALIISFACHTVWH